MRCLLFQPVIGSEGIYLGTIGTKVLALAKDLTALKGGDLADDDAGRGGGETGVTSRLIDCATIMKSGNPSPP